MIQSITNNLLVDFVLFLFFILANKKQKHNEMSDYKLVENSQVDDNENNLFLQKQNKSSLSPEEGNENEPFSDNEDDEKSFYSDFVYKDTDYSCPSLFNKKYFVAFGISFFMATFSTSIILQSSDNYSFKHGTKHDNKDINSFNFNFSKIAYNNIDDQTIPQEVENIDQESNYDEIEEPIEQVQEQVQEQVNEQEDDKEVEQNLGINSPGMFLAFAGLRNHGHDLIRSALSQICSKSKCVRVCSASNPELQSSSDVTTYNAAYDELEHEMHELSKRNDGKIYIMNLWGDCKSSSYNNFDSLAFPPEKLRFSSYSHPDFSLMNRIAKKNNINFRVITLISNDLKPVAQDWLLKIPKQNKRYTPIRVLQALSAQLSSLLAQLLQLNLEQITAIDIKTGTVVDAYGRNLQKFTNLKNFDLEIFKAFARVKDQERLNNASKSDLRRDFKLNDDDDYFMDTKPMWESLKKLFSNNIVSNNDEGLNKFSTVGPLPSADQNQTTKIIFFSGLEGTGHHLWASILKSLKQHSRSQARESCPLPSKLYSDRTRAAFFNPNSLSIYSQVRANVKTILKGLPKGKTYHASFLNCHRASTGAMSYPNFDGTFKNLQRPDMVKFTLAAKKVNVQNKYIILIRNMQEVIKSTVDHRHFTKEIREIGILKSNLEGIIAQLATIDKSYVSACVDYSDKQDISFLDKMNKDFDAPDLPLIYHTIVKNKTWASKHGGSSGDKVKFKRRKKALESMSYMNEYIKKHFC